MTTIDKVVNEFSMLLSQAEELLVRAGSESGEQARDLQADVATLLVNAKSRLDELEQEATERAAALVQSSDDYVHKNPWQALGFAAIAGFLLGTVITRR